MTAGSAFALPELDFVLALELALVAAAGLVWGLEPELASMSAAATMSRLMLS